MDQTLQTSLLTSDDVAKGPRGTNVPMAIKFSPDGECSYTFEYLQVAEMLIVLQKTSY